MNATGLEDPAGKQELQREAALWVARSRENDASQLAQLDAWLEQSDEHCGAYYDALAVWQDLGCVLPDWKCGDVATVPAANVTRAAGRPRVLAAMAIFASIMLASLLAFHWFTGTSSFSTGIGEQRTVSLADGTVVVLNTDSQISLARFGDERRVTLERGEAFFDVAHDSSRPFLVTAADRTVRVLGTSFIVRRVAQRVDVTLLTGTVRVEQGGAAPVRLEPGQRLRQVLGQQGQIDAPPIAMVTAWRNGELMLDETLLTDAIAEMNRYSAHPIILHDPALGQRRLSGLFATDDTRSFAITIGAMYGLRVQDRADGLHLLP